MSALITRWRREFITAKTPASVYSTATQILATSTGIFCATDKPCEHCPEELHITHGSSVRSRQLNMPRQLTLTEIRLNNITTYLNPTITLLKEINDAFQTPFIQPIVNTTLSLITAIQVMNLLSCCINGSRFTDCQEKQG
jgi:hypothetical protein